MSTMTITRQMHEDQQQLQVLVGSGLRAMADKGNEQLQLFLDEQSRRLETTLQKHDKSPDFPCRSLCAWIREVQEGPILRNGETWNESTLPRFIAAKGYELGRKILVDQISREPLELGQTAVHNDFVLNGQSYLRMQRYFKYSPLDNRKIARSIQPHPMSEEMLLWMEGVVQQLTGPEEETALVSVKAAPLTIALRGNLQNLEQELVKEEVRLQAEADQERQILVQTNAPEEQRQQLEETLEERLDQFEQRQRSYIQSQSTSAREFKQQREFEMGRLETDRAARKGTQAHVQQVRMMNAKLADLQKEAKKAQQEALQTMEKQREEQQRELAHFRSQMDEWEQDADQRCAQAEAAVAQCHQERVEMQHEKRTQLAAQKRLLDDLEQSREINRESYLAREQLWQKKAERQEATISKQAASLQKRDEEYDALFQKTAGYESKLAIAERTAESRQQQIDKLSKQQRADAARLQQIQNNANSGGGGGGCILS